VTNNCLLFVMVNEKYDFNNELTLRFVLVVATSESFASNDDESDELNQRFLEFLTALAPVALNVLNGLAGNSMLNGSTIKRRNR